MTEGKVLSAPIERDTRDELLWREVPDLTALRKAVAAAPSLVRLETPSFEGLLSEAPTGRWTILLPSGQLATIEKTEPELYWVG